MSGPAPEPTAVARRARTLIGSRFRRQGRCAEQGLDCIGVAVLALGLDAVEVRSDYGLDGGRLEELEAELARHGLRRVAGAAPEPGDILVFAPGCGRLHLAVQTKLGFVHADAGLRRIVERPQPAPWPLAGVWRLQDRRKGNAQWRR